VFKRSVSTNYESRSGWRICGGGAAAPRRRRLAPVLALHGDPERPPRPALVARRERGRDVGHDVDLLLRVDDEVQRRGALGLRRRVVADAGEVAVDGVPAALEPRAIVMKSKCLRLLAKSLAPSTRLENEWDHGRIEYV